MFWLLWNSRLKIIYPQHFEGILHCSPLLPSSPHLAYFPLPQDKAPKTCLRPFFFFLKRFYLFVFRERGREGEREGEKHQCARNTSIGCLPCTPPARDLAQNPCMYPDWESNQWPFNSQAGTQSTELHQPGCARGLLYHNGPLGSLV